MRLFRRRRPRPAGVYFIPDPDGDPHRITAIGWDERRDTVMNAVPGDLHFDWTVGRGWELLPAPPPIPTGISTIAEYQSLVATRPRPPFFILGHAEPGYALGGVYCEDIESVAG